MKLLNPFVFLSFACLITSSLSFARAVNCNDPSVDLRKAPIGFRCKIDNAPQYGETVERVAWEKFGEAWREEDGLIWSEPGPAGSKIVGTLEEAEIECKRLGGRVPSAGEMQKALFKGLGKVLKHSGTMYLVAAPHDDLSCCSISPFGPYCMTIETECYWTSFLEDGRFTASPRYFYLPLCVAEGSK